MWIVSLDEWGWFEQDDLNGLHGVSGAIFCCETKEDAESERQRLICFFKTVCEEQHAFFPGDLHYDNYKPPINADAVHRVKRALENEMSDFLLGMGRWQQNRPRGHYELYGIVGDRNGIGLSGKSNLLRDEHGTNRYEHMAYRVIRNLLFFNPRGIDSNVRLELATRSHSIDPKVLREIDYIKSFSKEAETKYYVTNVNSYRAVLLQSLLENPNQDTRFELKVSSIKYELEYAYENVFLYLADTLCSIFWNAIKYLDDCGNALLALINRCNQMLGENRCHFWAYHPIDISWHYLYNCYKFKADYKSFRQIINMRHWPNGYAQPNAYAQAYDQLWLKFIENKIIAEHKPTEHALTCLNQYLEDSHYRLDIADALLDMFKKQCSQLTPCRESAPILFKLAKAEMTIANHHGSYKAAAKAYQNAVEWASYLPIEDYLDLRNMLTEALLDSEHFNEALQISKESVNYAENLCDIQHRMLPNATGHSPIYGRCLSQLAQSLAFKGRYAEASPYFEKAIVEFGNNQTEIQKTRSFYLHNLIESQDAEKYQNQAKLYFGKDTLKEQIEVATNKGADYTSQKFMLYVLVKALYFFPQPSFSEKEVLQLTQHLLQFCLERKDKHPWEMIMKYCALLRMKYVNGDDNIALRCMDQAEKSVEDSKNGILPKIVAEGKKQFELAKAHKNPFEGSPMTYMYR